MMNNPTRGDIRAIYHQNCKNTKPSTKLPNLHGVEHINFKKYKYNKKPTVFKTTVKNLDLQCVKPQRAGIILYTIHNGNVYFALGLDSKSHDLTDFGGHIVYQYDENVVCGALREFNEETLEMFDDVKYDDIQDCPVIYDEKNLIIFMHVICDPDVVCRSFNSYYDKQSHNIVNTIQKSQKNSKKKTESEVCGITWLTWEDFKYSINNDGILFSRIQRFLQNAGDFSYLL